MSPSRTPRVPSIGLPSSSARIRSSTCSSSATSARPPEPGLGQPLDQLVAVGQELVQRRVEQADRHRQLVHRLEQALEVGLLERQQLIERGAPARRRRRP